MIGLQSALTIMSENIVGLSWERINISEALGRVLYEDIFSPIDLPPFNKALMDGYACSSTDDSESFRIIDTIPAAKFDSPLRLFHGECVKIMTGAVVPEGADIVIRVEFTEESNGFMRINKAEKGQNISKRADNLKNGEKVFSMGKLLRPQDIGILASLGIELITVYSQPKIAVICTGDEIVEAKQQLNNGEIYNGNSPILLALLRSMGIVGRYYGIVPDIYEKLFDTVSIAKIENDVILISGGVSMGDFDFVPTVIKELDYSILFNRVSVKPGKPTTFARNGNKFLFGIPGNPVSTFVIFELFVKKFIYGMMGHDYKPLYSSVVALEDIFRKDTERTEYIPVKLSGDGIESLMYKGSSHVNILAESDALAQMDIGQNQIKKGTMLYVRHI